MFDVSVFCCFFFLFLLCIFSCLFRRIVLLQQNCAKTTKAILSSASLNCVPKEYVGSFLAIICSLHSQPDALAFSVVMEAKFYLVSFNQVFYHSIPNTTEIPSGSLQRNIFFFFFCCFTYQMTEIRELQKQNRYKSKDSSLTLHQIILAIFDWPIFDIFAKFTIDCHVIKSPIQSNERSQVPECRLSDQLWLWCTWICHRVVTFDWLSRLKGGHKQNCSHSEWDRVTENRQSKLSRSVKLVDTPVSSWK